MNRKLFVINFFFCRQGPPGPNGAMGASGQKGEQVSMGGERGFSCHVQHQF